jgi:hypothetical protein
MNNREICAKTKIVDPVGNHVRLCWLEKGHEGDHETIFRQKIYRWPQT